MKLKQWPIWDIHTSYVCDAKVLKIVWTDKQERIIEIDMPKWVF